MIERIIAFSARNRFVVLVLTSAAIFAGRLVDQPHRARRAAGPLRHAGHRVLALGSQPRHHRRPGDLPRHHRDAGGAKGQGNPGVLGLRLLLRVRDLRGGHGPLLGAQPHARVPLQDSAPASRGRADRARTRRHRSGLGLSVRAGRRIGSAFPGGPAVDPGLEHPLRPPVRAGRGGGRQRRRLRAPVPGHRRPEPPVGLSHPPDVGRSGDSRLQQRSGRAPGRMERRGVHGAGPGLHPFDRRSRGDRRQDRRKGHAGASA